MVGLVVLLFFIVSGLPFRRSDKIQRAQPAAVEPVAEGTASAPPSGALVDTPATTTQTSTAIATATLPPNTTIVPPEMGTQPPPVTTTPPPVIATTTPARVTPPPPRVSTPPATATQTQPPATSPQAAVLARPRPAAPAPTARNEISESEAAGILRGAAASYYDGVERDCMAVRSEGYRNAGYTMTVWDKCSGDYRLLGRWRVDSKTSEAFLQQEDGRYQRP